MTDLFVARDQADIAALVRANPLALVVSHGADAFRATPLPLLPEIGADGAIAAFLGHFALSNPQVALVRADPRALVIFQGPHGYISPSAVSNPTWAPTWNYAIAQFEVEIRLAPEENGPAIEQLVEAMEGDRWSTARIGGRYERMLRHIVAFHADVLVTRARFKLGQDEPRETFAEICAAEGDTPLGAMMRAFGSPPSTR